jgi:hypothetical protein
LFRPTRNVGWRPRRLDAEQLFEDVWKLRKRWRLTGNKKCGHTQHSQK